MRRRSILRRFGPAACQNLAMRHDLVAMRNVARERDELVKAILARDAQLAIDLRNAHARETGRLAVASRQDAKQD